MTQVKIMETWRTLDVGSWTVAVHGHVKDYLDIGSGVMQLFMGSYLCMGSLIC
jgi:hypothetical protein